MAQESVRSIDVSVTSASIAHDDTSVVDDPSQRASEISLTASHSITCTYPANDIVMAGLEAPISSSNLEYMTKFPVIYVSPAGLLTVLMRHEMAVEMTVDRTIRVVNHRHKAVAATNSRGSSSCVYHTAAKVFQASTNTDVDIFWGRKAKMSTDSITICSGSTTINLSPQGLQPCKVEFPDMSKDNSVSLLFSSSAYGPNLIPVCYEIAQNATYTYHKRGGITVLINGMRIFQNSRGDVMVACGRKYIRSSALNGTFYLETHFVEMAIELNWRIRVKRGGQQLLANFNSFMVSDGSSEAGFGPHGQMIYQPVIYITHTIIDNTGKAEDGDDEQDVEEESSSDEQRDGEQMEGGSSAASESNVTMETEITPSASLSASQEDSDTQITDAPVAMETKSCSDIIETENTAKAAETPAQDDNKHEASSAVAIETGAGGDSTELAAAPEKQKDPVGIETKAATQEAEDIKSEGVASSTKLSSTDEDEFVDCDGVSIGSGTWWVISHSRATLTSSSRGLSRAVCPTPGVWVRLQQSDVQ